MLDTARSRIWEAMRIGPQWLLRDTEDPLLDEMTKKRLAPAPVRGAAVRPDAPPISTEVPQPASRRRELPSRTVHPARGRRRRTPRGGT